MLREPSRLCRREDELLAFPARDGVAPLAEQDDLDRGSAVEPGGDCAWIEPAAGRQIEVAGTVGRERGDPIEIRHEPGERNGFVHRGLAVIGHHDDRIAFEQAVDPTSGLGQRADGRIAALQLGESSVGAMLMRGVVVVGEIEDEKVESIPRHEPAGDRSRVGVDRACRTVAPGERCPGAIGAEEVVEEETFGPADVPEEREGRTMERSASVRREVDRRRAKAGVREGLEHRHGPPPEVLPVHVDERVPQRPADPGGAHGAERAAVFDDPLLPTVVPDEVRDLMDVAMGAGRDRREANRSERREDGCRTTVGAPGRERGEGRGVAGADRALQHRRGQAVDDHEDQRERRHFASERRPAYFSGPLRARRAARTGRATASR